MKLTDFGSPQPPIPPPKRNLANSKLLAICSGISPSALIVWNQILSCSSRVLSISLLLLVVEERPLYVLLGMGDGRLLKTVATIG